MILYQRKNDVYDTDDLFLTLDEIVHNNQPNYAKGIESGFIWSCYNAFTDVSNRLYKYDDIFPTLRLEFENMTVNVPRNWHLILKKGYGDYLELPDDMVSHAHVTRSKDVMENCDHIINCIGPDLEISNKAKDS